MALCKSVLMAVSGGSSVSVPYIPANLTYVAIDISTSGDHTFVAASVGKTTKIYKLVFQVAGAVTVKLKDGGSDVSGKKWPLDVGGSVALDLDKYANYESAANSQLQINTDAAVQVSGHALVLTD